MINFEWICVIDICSGDLWYLGESEAVAAKALEPGTIFAKAKNKMLAFHNAVALATNYRNSGYQRLEARDHVVLKSQEAASVSYRREGDHSCREAHGKSGHPSD